MFNLTNKSKEYLLNLFNTEKSIPDDIENYCKAEYGKDWYYAYITFKNDGIFPNSIRKSL